MLNTIYKIVYIIILVTLISACNSENSNTVEIQKRNAVNYVRDLQFEILSAVKLAKSNIENTNETENIILIENKEISNSLDGNAIVNAKIYENSFDITITFENWKTFKGRTLNGTISISGNSKYNDLNEKYGIHELTLKGDLNYILSNSLSRTMTYEINYSLEYSQNSLSFTLSGYITKNGETIDMDEFTHKFGI